MPAQLPVSRPPGSVAWIVFTERERLRLPVRQVANLAGLSFGHVARIEKGQSSPSSTVARALGLALDVPFVVLGLAAGHLPDRPVPPDQTGPLVALAAETTPWLLAPEARALVITRWLVRSSQRVPPPDDAVGWRDPGLPERIRSWFFPDDDPPAAVGRLIDWLLQETDAWRTPSEPAPLPELLLALAAAGISLDEWAVLAGYVSLGLAQEVGLARAWTAIADSIGTAVANVPTEVSGEEALLTVWQRYLQLRSERRVDEALVAPPEQQRNERKPGAAERTSRTVRMVRSGRNGWSIRMDGVDLETARRALEAVRDVVGADVIEEEGSLF